MTYLVAALIEPLLKKLYRVEVSSTKTTQMYVLAIDATAARDDAAEMLYECDWETSETDFWPVAIHERDFSKLPPDILWTGGPDGEDAKIEEWVKARAGVTAKADEHGGSM